MTGRERVWAALRGGPLDRPPKGEILITPGLVREFPCPDLPAMLAYLNADLVVLPAGENTAGPLAGHPPDWNSWARTGYFVFAMFQGPVTFLSEKLGWPEFSRLLIKNPEHTREIMHNYLREGLKPLIAALDAGCDGIIVFDDLAGDRGPLISPAFLQENYFPLLASLLAELNCDRVPCIFHSDGNILELVRYIRATGFWGIQGLQPSVGIAPENFRRPDLANWVYWGNFEFEGRNRLKSATEIKAGIDRLLSSWAGCPGYIFGSSGGLYEGLSPEAIKTAYDTVHTWRYKPHV